MEQVSKGLRPHIVLAGPVNAGKSTLFNRLVGQTKALVSPEAGTTTDTVSQAFELPGFGAVVFVDTPGMGDTGTLGAARIEVAKRALREADLILFIADSGFECFSVIKSVSSAPILPVFVQKRPSGEDLKESDKIAGGQPIVLGEDLAPLYARIAVLLRASSPDTPVDLTGSLVKPGDVVLLVMPQDSEAPKGRLILPQVQTIRELLDKHCLVLSAQPSEMTAALSSLKEPPKLIITDSQKFAEVRQLTPPGVPLTSFSVLMSAYKGDLKKLIEGAARLDTLRGDGRVLIAEACAHAPNGEDIGTVKLPRLLRKRFGPGLEIDHVTGKDFPEDLSGYDLVIHCGACMFNRAHLLSRQAEAEAQGVPMTNYGIAIAGLLGILSDVTLPS